MEARRYARHAVITTLSDETEKQLETQEIGPAEQELLQESFAQAWVKTFQAAESMHLCLHPSYVRHTDEELKAIVETAFQQRRGPSTMIAEMLADGARGLARTVELTRFPAPR